MNITTDFLVIGTGIAGLTYALKVAEHGSVALVTKRDIDVTATQLAQGGIAAVFSDTDSFEEHAEDTMVAGAYLPNRDIVDLVVSSGPRAVRDLIDWGVQFCRNSSNDGYDLTREGGHSHRRILHAKMLPGVKLSELWSKQPSNTPTSPFTRTISRST